MQLIKLKVNLHILSQVRQWFRLVMLRVRQRVLLNKTAFGTVFASGSSTRASPRSLDLGDGFKTAKRSLSPNIIFSSDFGHLIFKMLKNVKF